MALVLLIGLGLLVQSFTTLRNVNPGYDTKDIFTFQFAPERERLVDGPTAAQFHLDFLERLKALPGVTSVGIVENVPLNESVRPQRFHGEGAGGAAGAEILLSLTFAAGDYFSTMGIDLRSGRPLASTDHVAGLGNVVISEGAANQLWPGEDPLGRRFQPQGETSWFTVVGVVEDVKQSDFRDAGTPLVYLPLVGPERNSWVMGSPAYVVKTERAEFIAPEIRELVREVAPEAPMYRTFTMAGLAADSMAPLSFTMLILGIVSVLAVLLGAVGLYGVLSYIVAQRARELTIRMALGADSGRVRRMVVGQGVRLVAVGITVGLVIAAFSTRALGSLLFGVSGGDLLTFLSMALSMIFIGMLASYLPALRASRIDAFDALRGE